MLVVDAAQMYEVVPRALVLADTRRLLATLPPKHGVLVDHGIRLAGNARRKPRVVPSAMTWFSSDSLLSFTFLALLQCVVLCGGLQWAQNEGVPIGGIFSSVLSNIVLGYAENRWDLCWRALPMFKHVPSYWSRKHLFAPLRYEDDLFIASRSICIPCIKQVVPNVYPVSFDETYSGSRVVWTDLVVTATSEGSVHIQPKQGSPAMLWQDWQDDVGNMSIPPYIGQLTRSSVVITGTLAGRVSRLNQMCLDYRTFRIAAITDVIKWLHAGYSLTTLIALWRKVRIPGSHITRKFLASLPRRDSS